MKCESSRQSKAYCTLKWGEVGHRDTDLSTWEKVEVVWFIDNHCDVRFEVGNTVKDGDENSI